MKLPAFQFYPGDWRKDPGVQALDYHDRGVWLEVICLMHESEERGKLILNGKPMPEEALARLLGLDKQILSATLTTLLTYGVASRCEETGAIICRRMVRDEKLRKIRVEAGKKGGNPVLLKQKQTTQLKQIGTPSSSSSSSASTSVISHTDARASEVPIDGAKIEAAIKGYCAAADKRYSHDALPAAVRQIRAGFVTQADLCQKLATIAKTAARNPKSERRFLPSCYDLIEQGQYDSELSAFLSGKVPDLITAPIAIQPVVEEIYE
ncbi:hypothetical protein EBZ39_02840 [bacterium]|nr:hypothetical protein [bacterium]